MKKFLLILVVLIAIGGYVGATHIQSTIKGIIENAGTQALGTQVSVSGLDASLANRTASMTGLTVANPAGFKPGNFLKTNSISVTVGGLEDKVLTINEVVIDGMNVTFEANPAGTNFDTIRKNLKSTPAPAESTGEKKAEKSAEGNGYKVIIKKLRILNAQVTPDVSGLGKSFTKEITLPEIVLTDIGSKENPATPMEVAEQVMNRILGVSSASTLKAGLSSLPAKINIDNAKGALQGLLGK